MPKKSPAAQSSQKKEALQLLRAMLSIRRFEERAGQLYGMGYIGGFCHLYIGQEAVVVGVQSQLTPKDSVITGYRDHGHILACGADPKIVMAELTGRTAGCSKGKGGSMHMFAPEKGFYGGHGIVGAQVPIGTGIALSHKYRNTNGVCAAFFGDGAANQGQVYESFNMASLWQLPILYIIENNRYGMGTSVKRAAAGITEDGHQLWARGKAYKIPGEEVDGMDVFAVQAAAKKAIQLCREEQTPYIIEAETYRYKGHSMSDPAKYRSREEVQNMREKHDPIDKLHNRILEEKWSDPQTLKEMEKAVREEMREAAEFAQKAALPKPEELYTDVYANA